MWPKYHDLFCTYSVPIYPHTNIDINRWQVTVDSEEFYILAYQMQYR